jgi:hypothetical protein
MTLITWIQHTERVVGKNHPTLADVTNRPLRELVTALEILLRQQEPERPGVHL